MSGIWISRHWEMDRFANVLFRGSRIKAPSMVVAQIPFPSISCGARDRRIPFVAFIISTLSGYRKRAEFDQRDAPREKYRKFF
jgi:hypothetical protein